MYLEGYEIKMAKMDCRDAHLGSDRIPGKPTDGQPADPDTVLGSGGGPLSPTASLLHKW